MGIGDWGLGPIPIPKNYEFKWDILNYILNVKIIYKHNQIIYKNIKKY